MIDIFSMLVIFLIFGTIIGAAEIVFPKDVHPPFSKSKESTEPAPQVTISASRVAVSFPHQQEFATSLFSDFENPPITKFSTDLGEYVKLIEDLSTNKNH